MKNDRAIFKERQTKIIPEYIVSALPRSIIGLKKTGPTHRTLVTITLNEQWKEMVTLR